MYISFRGGTSQPQTRTSLSAEDVFDVTAGWLTDVPSRPKAGLVLAPGAAGGITSSSWSEFAAGLAEEGILTVRFELPYRLQGKKAPPKAESSVDGYREAFDRAREEFPHVENWFAGGRSYGGRVGSLAVAAGMPAQGLVLLAYPLHAPGRKDRLRVEHWPDLEVPCLFIQGTKDAFADLDLLRRSLQLLGREPRLCLVEGGDHGLRKADMSELAHTAGRWIVAQKKL